MRDSYFKNRRNQKLCRKKEKTKTKSLLLFPLFLNDLNTFLLKETSRITIWDIDVCAMLYADDLILLAHSEDDLQRQMNALGIHADMFKMEVNKKITGVQ